MLRPTLVYLLFPLALAGQFNPMLPENAVTKVSDRVYAIMGFPNIAIVVGERGTLVVDTGMGARNGAVIMKEAEKLAKGPSIYLTTTHVHAEHTTGEQGFPARTILIRPLVQQEEMNGATNTQIFEFFRNRTPEMKELLAGVKLRNPDILFEKELQLDLGGVTARIFVTGGGHTRGDELIFVEPDRTLISGDLVQNKQLPNMPNEDASPKRWIATLDQLAPLKPRYVVPDHGPLGDGSLIAQERGFLVDLQNRALALKKEGRPAAEAGRILTEEFRAKYPDWNGFGSLAGAVQRVYAE